MNNKDILRRLKAGVVNSKMSWEEANDIYFKLTNEKITTNALRCRAKDIKLDELSTDVMKEQYNADGTVEILKNITFIDGEEKTPEIVLTKLGFPPEKWEMITYTFGTWETFIKDHGLEMQTTVKVKVKPKEIKLTAEQMAEIAKDVFKEKVKPLKIITSPKTKVLDDSKLIESPAMELHLGELSCVIDTGENYDSKIAQNRFNEITQKTVELQRYKKCGTLLLSIGGDFFNADNNFDTTNKGTQQHSDVRWKKMFMIGLSLYRDAITTYQKEFNNIVIQYVPGNHDLTTSFYLFMALQEAFANVDNIQFVQNFKEMQCYVFGDCGIWSTHGSKNVNRTILSIPSEFPEEFGKTKFRELHMGHLHSESELKEICGIIPRRIGSPKGKGDWEYNERFGNSIQKHQLFVWEKGIGMTDISMIPFEPVINNDKKKLKVMTNVK